LRRYKAKRVKTRCNQEGVGQFEPRFQGDVVIIIIIIINDNVYGAVIVTMVTARVHPVHLMNAD